MSSVSQIIPNYFSGGISNQPDELKKPGQLRDCVNAFPDAVKGLYKRPGLEKIGELKSLCEGVDITQQGSYFHFSRESASNAQKQDYIGYVNLDGRVSVFRCSTGESIPVYYTDREISPNANEKIKDEELTYCSSNSYLEHEDRKALKFTTVNNYTFMTNPARAVTMSRSDNKRPYEAFIEITQLAYNREYLIDVDLVNTDVVSRYKKVTEISLVKTNDFGGDNKDPSCPANFRETVTLDGESGGGTGLVVEIESVGVQIPIKEGKEYQCAYRHNVTLVNGGRDFSRKDTCRYKNTEGGVDTEYVIEITKTEYVTSSADYQISGVLTPSNGDTVASIKGILDELRVAIAEATPIEQSKIELVGNGLYITHDEPFTITTSEKDLMNVLSNTDNELENPYCIVNNVSRLPLECKNGLVALVANSFSDDDDYWVKFNANYGDVTNEDPDSTNSAATGYWEEIAEPGGEVKLNSGTMPQALVYSRANLGEDGARIDIFVVAPVAWKERTCGNEDFNPSFKDFNITNLLFYRNRLCALSQENIIMTTAGDLFNWFPNSALAVSSGDPIDISAATDYSSILLDGLVGNNTLLLFSQLQQFQLTTDSDILSPSTAKILEISRYNYSSESRPFAIGTNVGFVSDRGGRAKVYELSNVFREGAVKIVEKSKIVSESFLQNVASIAVSPEDELILFSGGTTIIWMYKFLDGGDKLLQDAWVKWEFPYPVIYHFILDSTYYAVLKGDGPMFITRLSLEANPTQGPFRDLWNLNEFEQDVPFELKLEFPTINVVKNELGAYRSDTTSSLVIHRLHFNFSDVGTYDFEIKRDGYDDYNVLYERDVIYESRELDEYTADAAPLLTELERTIPVYTRNTALSVSLKSSFDQPLILNSMRWEGDYTDRYYKRV